MTEDEAAALARDWAEHCAARASGDEADRLFAAWERLDGMCRDDPDAALSVILRIAAEGGEEAVLANLAAGPLEDLLSAHGPAVIGRLEDACRRNARVRAAAGMAWRSGIDAEVWSRLQRAVGRG
ncbi:DUF6869 domain-containing protein [Rhodovulum sp. DZ06]|uniref:DUF6869 domain-containing protein n=1 Tax=Rhodovulum sp. DZ06 TaxID=3425126 RepID=UPI003D327432